MNKNFPSDKTPEDLILAAGLFVEKYEQAVRQHIFAEMNEDRTACLEATAGALCMVDRLFAITGEEAALLTLMLISTVVYSAYAAGVEYGKLLEKTDAMLGEVE